MGDLNLSVTARLCIATYESTYRYIIQSGACDVFSSMGVTCTHGMWLIVIMILTQTCIIMCTWFIPDVAEMVLNRCTKCTTTNAKDMKTIIPDSKEYIQCDF